MLGKTKEEIDAMFSSKDEAMKTSQAMMVHAWKALTDAFPGLQDQVHLLGSGEIRNECNRQLGEFTRAKNHFPVHLRSSPDFLQMLENVEKAYRSMNGVLGKRKQDKPGSRLSALPPIVPGFRSFDGQTKNGSPPLFIIRRENINFYMNAPRLGEGSFAFVCKCKVNDPNFRDETYACKVIQLDEIGIPRDFAAAIEGTIVDVTHRGIVRPLGICRGEVQPMLIFKFWNGGNLSSWLWMSNQDGTNAPPRGLHNAERNPSELPRFKKHIFHIINGILQTFAYLHSKDLLHNDFHAKNVFIHFSSTSDEVYAGVGDWGRATRVGTKYHAVALQSDEPAQIREARQNWPWLAPESLAKKPKPYTKESDIYSLGYVISRILNVIVLPANDPKRAFVQHIRSFCDKAMLSEPSRRPKAYEFAMCMAACRSYGLEVPRSAGLIPFDD